MASQRSAQVIPVPSLDQAAIGMITSVIANEYPRATPLGPWLKPSTIPTITNGVVAASHAKARPIRPVDRTNQESGFATANTNATGASNLKIGAASIHFAPSTMRTISSENRAQLMVTGTVRETSIRVASQERPGKALGIMLNPGKGRKGHVADRNIQLLHRQSDELEGPPIQSKRIRSPETTQEELLRVPRQEYDEAVTGGQSAKMQHRPDAGPAPRRTWEPREQQTMTRQQ